MTEFTTYPAETGFKKTLVLVVVALVVLAVGIDVFLQKQLRQGHTKEQEMTTSLRLASLRAQLEGALNANLLLISGAASYIATNPDVTEEEFTAFARELMRRPNLLKNVGAAPDFTLSYVYPREGNEAIIGLHYRDIPGQWEQARKAQESGRMEVAGPLSLVQGGLGLIGRAPVIVPGTDENKFWGLVSAVIDVDRLFAQVGLDSHNKEFQLAIRGKDSKGPKGEVFHGDPELFSPSSGPLLMPVALPSGSWQIAAVPAAGWSESPPGAIPTHLTILALLVLAAVIAYNLMVKGHQVKLVRESLGQAQALAHLGSWEEDIRNKTVWWSDEMFRILGLKPAEFTPILESFSGMVHPEDRETVQTAYRESSRSKTFYSLEYRIVRPGGQIRFVHEQGGRDYDAEGAVVRSMGTVQDITTRKEAEGALRESQALYQAIFYNNETVNLLIDPADGRIVDANPAACAFYGYTREELLDLHIWEINTLGEEEVAGLLTKASERRGAHYYFSHKLANGDIRDVEVFSSLVEHQGRPLMFSIVIDVTERRQAEEARRESEQFLESVVENIPLMLFIKDGWSQRYVRLNRAGEELMGYSREDLIGKTDYEFLPREDADYNAATDRKALRSGGVVDISEEEVETRGRGRRILHTKKIPILGKDGTPLYLLGISEDITERRQAEEALRESQGQLKTMLDSMLVGVMLIDAETHEMVHVNGYAAEVYGAPREEMLGKVCHNFVCPREEGNCPITDLREDMRASERIILSSSGERIPIQKSVTRVRLGGRDLLLESFVDIRNLKQAEETARESQRKFRAIADYTYDWESWFAPDGELKWVNSAVERVTGYAVDECLFMEEYPLPMVAEEDREMVRGYLKEALAGKIGDDREFRLVRKDGKVVSVAVSWQPIFDDGGESMGFRSSARDITERKRAEEELRKLTRAVEQSQAAIVITDKDGTIEYVNPHFCRVTGYTMEETLGQNPRVLKSGEHPDSFYREMWETLVAGHTWSGEICNKKKDGTLFWEHTTISPLTDEHGGITHFIAVKEDITGRKDLEQLREDVDRIMRHDLKTPLNGIIGLPQVMLEADNLSEEQLQYLNLIMESGYRMLGQINLSLDLYKMETGAYEFVPSSVDLGVVVDRLLKDLSGQAKAKGVAMEMKGECPCMVMAEELLSHTMLSNILANAVEASPEGGTVTVRIEMGEDVAVSVHNMGVVPEAIRDTFFEKYATSGKKQGTGLGTYSARLMAETQGGSIGFTTSQEAGTTVTIRLPKGGIAFTSDSL